MSDDPEHENIADAVREISKMIDKFAESNEVCISCLRVNVGTTILAQVFVDFVDPFDGDEIAKFYGEMCQHINHNAMRLVIGEDVDETIQTVH